MQPAFSVQLSAQQLLLTLAGTIPAELEGTLLRNGPGLLEIGGKPLSQPLDGDGMVRSCKCFPVCAQGAWMNGIMKYSTLCLGQGGWGGGREGGGASLHVLFVFCCRLQCSSHCSALQLKRMFGR